MKSPILLDRYLKRLAVTLGIEEGSLLEELKKLKSKRTGYSKTEPESWSGAESGKRAVQKKEPPAETLLLGLLIQDPSYWVQLEKTFPGFSCSGEKTRAVFSVFESLLRGGKRHEFSISMLMNRLHDDSLKTFVSELLLISWSSEEDRNRVFQDCIQRFRDVEHHAKLKQLRDEIAKAEELGDQNLVLKTMKVYQELLGQNN